MSSLVKSNFVFFVLLIIVSCSNKNFDSVQEMTKYISDEDNGLRYSKTINGVEYSLQYRPTDLVVNQELVDKKNEKEISSLREKYSKYMYFNLSMSLNNKELLSNVVRNKAKFGQMVNNLAFEMDQKVHLFTKEKDTIKMADFVYPRMYGMTNSTSLMIVYPREEQDLDQDFLTLTIEDLGLETGEVKFKISTKAILDQPQLKFN